MPAILKFLTRNLWVCENYNPLKNIKLRILMSKWIKNSLKTSIMTAPWMLPWSKNEKNSWNEVGYNDFWDILWRTRQKLFYILCCDYYSVTTKTSAKKKTWETLRAVRLLNNRNLDHSLDRLFFPDRPELRWISEIDFCFWWKSSEIC